MKRIFSREDRAINWIIGKSQLKVSLPLHVPSLFIGKKKATHTFVSSFLKIKTSIW